MPIPFRHFGLELNPETQLVEIGETDGPVAHAINQVLADVWRQIVLGRDPWH